MVMNLSIWRMAKLSLLAIIFTSTIGSAFASSTDKPSARWGHVFVYYPPTDSIILFGGASTRGSFLNDMWTYGDSGWTRIKTPTPPARGFAAAAYHPERRTVIIHGGRGNEAKTLSDFWEWDGQQWRLIEEETPFQVDHHEMVYAQNEKQLVLFGGWTGNEVTSETWVWAGEWKSIHHENESPPPRSAFGMVYNEARERIEIYGGLWINGQYADTWAWQNNKWRKLSGPYENSSLDHHSLFFDSELGETIIFGGKDYRYKMRGETKRLSRDGIINLIAEEGPSPRHSVNVAYDTKHQRGFLFGGKTYVGDEQVPLNDMWVWRAGHWASLEVD